MREEREQQKEKQLMDSGEWNEGVKEKRVSACAAQLGLRMIEKRARAGEGESTQAKCLMWITLGQTSEEDKTANMSLCSLLVFSNRCLVSPSPVMVTRPGWSDPANDIFLLIHCTFDGCLFLFLKLVLKLSRCT